MVKGRRKGIAGLLFPLTLLLLPGCGPTDEQMLQYEHVLAALGILMGLGMWRLGFLIGGRLGGKGFLCATCGRFEPAHDSEGPSDPCPRCGQTRPLAPFDAVTLARVRGESIGYARARLFKWAAILTSATFLVLAAPSIVGRTMDFAVLGHEPKYESVYWFPIWFALEFTEYPGLGAGLFFYSYHFLRPISLAVGNLELWWCIAGGYALTVLATGTFWYVGLRRIRWGWLVPVIWGLANAVWATLVYLWPFLAGYHK